MTEQATPVARLTMSIQPPTRMRTAAFDWPFEVQVALPASYGIDPERRYPVLWLTDGPLNIHLAVGLLNVFSAGGLTPEAIVVSVGCPPQEGAVEWQRRRTIEFWPPGEDRLYDGPGGDYLRAGLTPEPIDTGHGADPPRQAEALLGFLVDELRPALAAAWRMDDDHCLTGHSGGGMFASWALFARPGAFRRFIIGSPSLNASGRAALRLEAAHAAAHDDFAADVFFGAGEKEIGQPYLAAWGVVSSPVLMAETLRLRNYPSLRVATRIFPGKDHFSVIPDLLSEGMQAVWADRTEKSPRPFG